jgi:hypothetical protein
MTSDVKWLEEMIAEDEFGILSSPARSEGMTRDGRQIANFMEITEFVREHGRRPEQKTADMTEMTLAIRLKAIEEDSELRELLAPHDELNVLTEPEAPESLAEVVASDDLGLLEEDGESIHELRHVPKPSAVRDDIASRVRCEDFDHFEPLFRRCHAELRNGARHQLKFRNEQDIEADHFYVLRGQLSYVADKGEVVREHGRNNARLRVIFENGTEADLLLRSFSSQLYRFGKAVSEPEEVALAEVEERLGGATGYVYVLRSQSENELVKHIPDLHKIGYTQNPVEKRTSSARRSATFLGADVSIAATYEMPRSMAKKTEKLLHRFFADARLDAWFERDGVEVTDVREWFSVPLPVINEAIDLIEAETIVDFKYDAGLRCIKLASRSEA